MDRKNLVRIVVGFLAYCFTAGFVVLVPAFMHINERRAVHASMDTLPNMDPGVVISFQLILAIPLILLTGVFEVIRIWGLQGSPLSMPIAMLLGGLSMLPTVATFLPTIPSSFTLLFASFAVLVGVFYTTRYLVLKRREVGYVS